MAHKYVYAFGGGSAEGSAEMKDLLGGKGANLAEMARLGIPVPPGFTISTEACIEYFKSGGNYPEGMWAELEKQLAKVEALTNKSFSDPANPLLVSVRSGARVSMPGMMDTVLNLGLNDTTVEGLAKKAGDARFAYDSYRRFVTMFGDVVLGVPHSAFEKILEAEKEKHGAKLDTELSADSLKAVAEAGKKMVQEKTGKAFPEDPIEQLKLAINAVFKSWFNERAKTYRAKYGISEDWGTAVNVQAMVFGNTGEKSGTGVAFTRDPATGANEFYGEYLMNAQGEDVVAGIRTPEKIGKLKEQMPHAYDQLVDIRERLEKHYRDMQDIEFTIEHGELYMLQTRNGKRTGPAAIKVAVDMVESGMITKEEAILRVEPDHIEQMLHRGIDPNEKLNVIAKGLPASPGAAVGGIVFHAHDAIAAKERKEKVVLVRAETSPEDVGGMIAAEGILTARGGMTSHAAVVARGMGKCCVAGVSALSIDEEKKTMTVGGVTLKEGDIITLDGAKGLVATGSAKLVDPEMSGDFGKFMGWVDEVRQLGVRTNADNPKDSKRARDFGAEGIGLTRTEHMFFEADRLPAMREMILAEDEKGRRAALKKLLPMQREDFIGIFKAMDGLPVTIRLLDPPLHEFLPSAESDIKSLAADMGVSFEHLKNKVEELKEMNPMLGHRGCRLGISMPEITEMQATAIFEAACTVKKEGVKVFPEVMVPLIGKVEELENQKKVVDAAAKEVFGRMGTEVDYLVGTMIEIPRACVVADQVAKVAQFFSFGTNDLTQMTFGYSRDDAGKFIAEYLERGILPRDPFQSIDVDGVGGMVKMGVERGRKTNPKLKIGICGEHGGEPNSVEFCHKVGMNYVSCSPFRVPVARIAAAQAAVRFKR
ncbi:MAG: pyruvate, phosphate dikinase [Candidatus Coatesbacteria bacterium]|nr:pyruvate, phosphate dikinase [Candidatus Coatesbacteria bacterium]